LVPKPAGPARSFSAFATVARATVAATLSMAIGALFLNASPLRASLLIYWISTLEYLICHDETCALQRKRAAPV
jgi:hypothetical protein